MHRSVHGDVGDVGCIRHVAGGLHGERRGAVLGRALTDTTTNTEDLDISVLAQAGINIVSMSYSGTTPFVAGETITVTVTYQNTGSRWMCKCDGRGRRVELQRVFGVTSSDPAAIASIAGSATAQQVFHGDLGDVHRFRHAADRRDGERAEQYSARALTDSTTNTEDLTSRCSPRRTCRSSPCRIPALPRSLRARPSR